MPEGYARRKYAKVEINEEGMREGMQIQDKDIPVEAKIRLLDALSQTGLKSINIGSFVSPRYTPQMREIDTIAQNFTPRPGVRYHALALNERGRERAAVYADRLSMAFGDIGGNRPMLGGPGCDVFTRRNTNQPWTGDANWPQIVQRAKERGATEAGISAGLYGSNFTGHFSFDEKMAWMERAHAMWDEAGIKVTACSFGDSMGWCMPHETDEIIEAVKSKWPEIKHWSAHLHNSRGMSLTCIYAALKVLEPDDDLHVDTCLGGIGGCPYCGNGRATGMAPTEDLVNMLEEMGQDTGVDLKKLIECVWMLEEIVGRPTEGKVSKAGPRPRGSHVWPYLDLYDPNIPFVETYEQARHFILGAKAFEGQEMVYPWDKPIESDQRKAVDERIAAEKQAAGVTVGS
jgi:hydroxymethylglutaryl-CoA lyase